jgi:hypothetical protein
VQAREDNGEWQAQWRLWLGDEREQGKAQGADQATLADAVLLMVSERLALRYVVAPGAASNLTLEVQGTDLARYAELQRILQPLAAQLHKVEGDRLIYQVNANAEQLRAQLALMHLQEVAVEAQPVDAGQSMQPPTDAPAPQVLKRDDVLRFRW